MSRFLFLPYLLYSSLIWHLARLLSREPACNQVNDRLWVGRRLLAHELPCLFDHFVDLTAEFSEPEAIRTQAGYLAIPVLDATVPRASEVDHFLTATAEGVTFIHCAQGHGRTGFFAAAWLVGHGAVANAVAAVALLQKARPGIALNRQQLRFLKDYVSSDRFRIAASGLPRHGGVDDPPGPPPSPG